MSDIQEPEQIHFWLVVVMLLTNFACVRGGARFMFGTYPPIFWWLNIIFYLMGAIGFAITIVGLNNYRPDGPAKGG